MTGARPNLARPGHAGRAVLRQYPTSQEGRA